LKRIYREKFPTHHKHNKSIGSWVAGWGGGCGEGVSNGRGLFIIRCYTCLVVFVFLLLACRHFLIADLITLLDFFEPDLSALTANIGPENTHTKDDYLHGLTEVFQMPFFLDYTEE
jgi:hypothetical protein